MHEAARARKPCSPFVFAAPHSRLLVENSKLGSGTEQVEARQSGGANKPREGNRYNLKKKTGKQEQKLERDG